MTSEKSYDNAQRMNSLIGNLAVTDPNGWVNVGRLNSWSVQSGSSQASPAVTFIDYAQRFVCFQGVLNTGTVADGTAVMNVPSAYRPKNAKVPFAVGTISGSATLTNAPYFEIQLSGDVQCFGVKASMTAIRFSVVYAIDAPAA